MRTQPAVLSRDHFGNTGTRLRAETKKYPSVYAARVQKSNR